MQQTEKDLHLNSKTDEMGTRDTSTNTAYAITQSLKWKVGNCIGRWIKRRPFLTVGILLSFSFSSKSQLVSSQVLKMNKFAVGLLTLI